MDSLYGINEPGAAGSSLISTTLVIFQASTKRPLCIDPVASALARGGQTEETYIPWDARIMNDVSSDES